MPSTFSPPTKSVYKNALSSRSVKPWHWTDELQFKRLCSSFPIALLCLAIGLYVGGITNQSLIQSTGDGQNIWSATLGYSQICFTGQNPNGGITLPNTCATIGSDCSINNWSQDAINFMTNNYGIYDSSLHDCTEFNGYRAMHVMGIILSGLALILMVYTHGIPIQMASASKLKITAMCIAFLAGSVGVIAQCIFIDWWNYNQQYLVTFGYASEFVSGSTGGGSSTPSYVNLANAMFLEVAGWICAMSASLIYIAHFPS